VRPSHVYCPAMVPPCEGEARETRRVHTRICQGTYKRYATTSFARLAVFGRVLADRQSQPVVLPLKAVQQPAPRENERRGSRHQGCGRSMLRPSGLSKVAFTKECQVGAGALRKHAFAVPFSSARVIVRHVIAFRENTTRCRWRGFDRLNDAGASRACALRGLRAGTHTASLWCCPAWWFHSFFGWRARRKLQQHVLTRLPATHPLLFSWLTSSRAPSAWRTESETEPLARRWPSNTYLGARRCAFTHLAPSTRGLPAALRPSPAPAVLLTPRLVCSHRSTSTCSERQSATAY
jgi:hypothetical protein